MATYGVRVVINGMKQTFKSGLTKEEATEIKNTITPPEGWEVQVFIEMNQHEKVINRLISQCVTEWIGGLENQVQDSEEDSEEYKNAKAMLNHDSLFSAFYSDIMVETRKNAKSHLRFAGKQFIEERIEAALKRNGYGK